jgi:hypothetical protein
MSVSGDVREAIQDVVAPDLKVLQAEVKSVAENLQSLDPRTTECSYRRSRLPYCRHDSKSLRL